MKKNRFIRASVWLLALTMLAMCAFAGNTTLAMYASKGEGVGVAGIAGWSIKVGGARDTVDPTIWVGGEELADATGEITELTVDLFSTIKCEGTEGPDAKGDTETNTSGLLAPGTWGEFDLDVYNNSDVDARITVTIVPDFTDAALLAGRIVFKGLGDDGNTSPVYNMTNTYELAPGEAISDKGFDGTLEWAWSFADGSVAGVGEFADDALIDTPIGMAALGGAYELTATAVITAVQID